METLRAIYNVTKVLAFYVGHSYQVHASTTRFAAMTSSDWATFTTWMNSSIPSEGSTLVYAFSKSLTGGLLQLDCMAFALLDYVVNILVCISDALTWKAYTLVVQQSQSPN